MNIKKTRKSMGLSQAKAAALIGVPLRTWEDWERDIFQPPEYVAKLICDELISGGKVDTISQSFKEIRKYTGLTQKQTAEFLNMPFFTYRNWENSSQKPPLYVENLIKKKLKNFEK